MKLKTILNSGHRLKDFADMYGLLEKFTLHELLDACQRKYPDLNINMVKHSLIHFDYIIFSPIELQKAFHNPFISFGLPESTRKLLQNRSSKQRKEEGTSYLEGA